MRAIAWTEGAVADLDHIRRYVAAFDAAAAQRLADRIAVVTGRLAEEQIADGTLEWAIVPPFLLRFRADADSAIILAVRHSSRCCIV